MMIIIQFFICLHDNRPTTKVSSSNNNKIYKRTHTKTRQGNIYYLNTNNNSINTNQSFRLEMRKKHLY
jgi:hypothetical protein